MSTPPRPVNRIAPYLDALARRPTSAPAPAPALSALARLRADYAWLVANGPPRPDDGVLLRTEQVARLLDEVDNALLRSDHDHASGGNDRHGFRHPDDDDDRPVRPTPTVVGSGPGEVLLALAVMAAVVVAGLLCGLGG